MRYNTLVAGSQNAIIDELFTHLGDRLRCITTSLRIKDVTRHIRIFEPDIFILCIKDQEREIANLITQVRSNLDRNDIVLCIIGDKEDIEELQSLMDISECLVLKRPLTNAAIITAIDDYIDERRRIKEEAERRAEEERRAKEEQEKCGRKHVLIVDDDPNMLKLIKEQLEDTYNVATAINGSLALRFLTKKTTDLILLDYEMPGQSGADVFNIIRGSESTKRIPVVFLTGVSEPEKVKKVLSLKPEGYLLKPVDRNKLRYIVAKIMEESNG